MTFYAEATFFTKTSLIVIPIALLIHIVAFATDYWATFDLGNLGLWNNCTEPMGCITYAKLVYYYDYPLVVWMKGVQAMGILVIMGLIFVFVIVAAYFCMDPFPSNDRLVQLALGTQLLVCLFIFVGIAVFAVKFEVPPQSPTTEMAFGYSFIIEIVAGILCVVAAVVLACDQCCYRYLNNTNNNSHVQPTRNRQWDRMRDNKRETTSRWDKVRDDGRSNKESSRWDKVRNDMREKNNDTDYDPPRKTPTRGIQAYEKVFTVAKKPSRDVSIVNY